MFKVNDIVTFGRPNGEQTLGRVLRVNAASITILQVEERGQRVVRQAGERWRVHPSLVKHAPTPNTVALKDMYFGLEIHHPTWGSATVIGRYDDKSWEVRNGKGHTVIRDSELREWNITRHPLPTPEK